MGASCRAPRARSAGPTTRSARCAPIAAAPEVSDEHRQWLYDLYLAATKDPEYQEKRLQISGLQILDLDTAGLRELADTAIEKVKPIYIEKGIYWEQQK